MQVDIVSDIVEGRIDIDLRNIEGNRSCIKKVRLYKDGSQSEPIFTKDVTADFRITLPGDNESLFCENTQMKILLSDHQDNQIGEMKTLSLLKLSNEVKKIVLKPVNNDILNSCQKKNYLLTIYCKNSLTEVAILKLRRSLRLYEDLMDLDIGEEMSGKYCSLVDSEEHHHWTFIGEDSPQTGAVEKVQSQDNSCQNLLIFQILSCLLLLLIVVSMLTYLGKWLLRNTTVEVDGKVEEQGEVGENDNVPPLRDVPMRNVVVEMTNLRKRGSVNQSFEKEDTG